jgi:hypothetical protein
MRRDAQNNPQYIGKDAQNNPQYIGKDAPKITPNT